MPSLEQYQVLHIVGGSSYGGGSKVILDLAAGSKAEGARVDVLTTDTQLASEARAQGIGVVNIDAIGRRIHPIQDFRGFVRLVRFLRMNGYDVVHTHTSKAGIMGRLAASVARTPVIIHTVHGFAFHERSPLWQKLVVVTAERMASVVSSRVVTVSFHHYDVARATRAVPARKLIAIPNGISVVKRAVDADGVANSRNDLLLPGTDVAILCHGRLAPQKGIRYLLEALSLMRGAGSLPNSVTVSIAGDGPLAAELHIEAAERQLGNVVQFLGFRTDIHSLIDAADAVVLPSLWEGLSIALMEAMARGALVAVSDIPSNLELIRDGETGVVFPAADSSALADSLTDLLGQLDDLRPLGEAAREDIARSHSREGMQTAYNRVYAEELAAKNR